MYIQNAGQVASGEPRGNFEYISAIAYQSVESIANSFVAHLPYIAAGLIVITVFWLIGKITKRIFLFASARTNLDTRLQTLFSRIIDIGIFVMGIIAALPIMIPNFSLSGMVASLGFASFIIGFAARDIFNDLLSGILILWNEPFRSGDYIFIQNNEGEVAEIGMRVTSLKKDDGETIQIPNREVYSNALIVRNAGAKRRVKLTLTIDFDSSIEKTKDLINEALEKEKGVQSEPTPSVYVTDLSSQGVEIAVFFWIDSNQNSPIRTYDRLATEIKEALCREKISLYPPNVVLLKDPGSAG